MNAALTPEVSIMLVASVTEKLFHSLHTVGAYVLSTVTACHVWLDRDSAMLLCSCRPQGLGASSEHGDRETCCVPDSGL